MMKYFWNFSNNVDYFSDFTNNEYALLKEGKLFSVNRSAFEIWSCLKSFDGKTVNDCVDHLSKIMIINDLQKSMNDIQNVLDIMADEGLIEKADNNIIQNSYVRLLSLKETIHFSRYVVEKVQEWHGEYLANESSRIIVEKPFDFDYESCIGIDDSLLDDIEGQKSEIVFIVPEKSKLYAMNEDYLCLTRGEKADAYKKYIIGNLLLPSAISRLIPVINSRFSIRKEDEGDGFVYDFDLDKLSVANKSAILFLESINGQDSLELCLINCLESFNSADNFEIERIAADFLRFIFKQVYDEVIFFE